MPVDPLIYATTSVPLAEVEVRRLNGELMDQVGADRFAGPDDCALTIVPAVEHESHCDELPDAETLVQAHPKTPYYGANYERGDWTELAAILEFMRRRIPSARIWYGDDSGDTVAEVTEQWMSEMWDYWAVNGGRPYRSKRRDSS